MEDQEYQCAFKQLSQLGFQDTFIRKALELTRDIDRASQIALKLADEGIDADLSSYYEPKKQTYSAPNKWAKAKMLFVVNGELKMGKGKICAQVGHAVIGAYTQIEQEAKYDERARARLDSWNQQGTPKIVVKAETQQEIRDVMRQLEKLDASINVYLVEDAGHTQIKAGSQTVLAIGPVYAEQIDPVTSHFKLL